MFLIFKFISFLFLLDLISSKSDICKHVNPETLEDSHQVYSQSMPRGYRKGAASVIMKRKANTIIDCIKLCCSHENCNSVTYLKAKCFLIKCKTVADCSPKEILNLPENYNYVVVKDAMLKKLSNPEEIDDHKKSKSEFVMDNEISTTSKQKTSQTESNFKTTQTKTTDITNSMSTLKSTKKPHKPKQHPTKKYKLQVNAGSDQTVTVNRGYSRTIGIVTINGSCKHNSRIDNNEIQYIWTRLPDSLAVGRVVNGSDRTLSLSLVDLIPGKFMFQLTASVKEKLAGETASDSMTLTVVENNDVISRNLMETVLKTDIYHFTENDEINFASRLGHIIEKYMKYPKAHVSIEEIQPTYLNETKISFYASYFNNTTKKYNLISALSMEVKLKLMLIEHKYMLDCAVRSFQSKVCYFDCNGHGVCSQLTHTCYCRFPWMSNSLRERNTGIPNCSMHTILLVVSFAAILFVFILIFMCCRRIGRRCRRRSTYGNDTLKYKLVDNAG